MKTGPSHKFLTLLLSAFIFSMFTANSHAHEPIFGLGPHVIYKGGTGIELEFEGEKTSGAGELARPMLIEVKGDRLYVPEYLERQGSGL